MEKVTTDVLIIGAGAAGFRAALAACEADTDVLIVAKRPVAESGSTFSTVTKGWGIQALLESECEDQNLEEFYDDIMRAGLGKCDPKLAQILVEESGSRFNDLLSYGIRFKKDSDGNYLRVKGCFSNTKRAFITENFENVTNALKNKLSTSNVKFIEGSAIDLMIRDGQCLGAWIINNEKHLLQVNAKASILANGGGAGIFKNHMVNGTEIGDGYTLAHRAGAELINLEFIQFVLGYRDNGSRQFLPPAQLKCPEVLLNSDGKDLLKSCIPDHRIREKAIAQRNRHVPFSCRDHSYLIDVAIAEEVKKGKPVYWVKEDSRHFKKVSHFAHAFNGGVKIDENGETDISGLFAAGEVAAGPHGSDRLGGCMMTATQVFGARAGQGAAKHAKKINRSPGMKAIPESIKKRVCSDVNLRLNKVDSITERIKSLKKQFSRKLMVLRDRKGIQSCLSEITETDAALNAFDEFTSSNCFDVKNIITVMKLIATAALEQNVSLGSHYRSDHIPFSLARHPEKSSS